MWLLVSLLAAIVAQADAMTWSSCAPSPFAPSDVSLNPDPPVSGDEVAFKIQGRYEPASFKTIPEGQLNVAVQFMGTPIYQTTWDLCSKTSCPIQPGDLEVVYKQTLPPVAPPGKYQVRLEAQDDDSQILFCMLVDFKIAPPSVRRVAESLRQVA